jgi:hypothetical protein
MHLGDDGGAATGQPIDDIHFPQRLVAVQQLGEDAARQFAQLRFVRGRLQRHVENVAADIEFRIVLPGGQPDVQERPHCLLPVAREQIQFSLDAFDKLVEWQRAVANGNAADVQRHFLALEIQKYRIERPELLGEFAWGHGGFPRLFLGFS